MRVFDFDSALVRTPAPSVTEGLSAGGEAPSYQGVIAEHGAYVAALEQAGIRVETLPALDEFPDSLFVEDPAFVMADGAILLRPGAASRLGEAAELRPALAERFDRLLELDEGYADGGDILVLPDEILVGLSARTDAAGAQCFAQLAAELGRRARIVQTPESLLHFKTGCALLDEETMVATRVLAEAGLFGRLEMLVVPEGEESAANLLRINDVVLVAAGYPRTLDLLAARGHQVIALDVAEIGKIDAGLSCMSLRWKRAGSAA